MFEVDRSMDKRSLTETDIRIKFITPAIVAAGWNAQTQVREEYTVSAGRIMVRGRMHSRGAPITCSATRKTSLLPSLKKFGLLKVEVCQCFSLHSLSSNVSLSVLTNFLLSAFNSRPSSKMPTSSSGAWTRCWWSGYSVKDNPMPQINQKYDRLTLTCKYMKDPLLMALAWKKSHEYIRTTNWYADNFELDKSALNLAQRCKDWTDELSNNSIFFNSLKLVPAPKTSTWVFVKNESSESEEIIPNDDPCYCLRWEPQKLESSDKPDNIKLRPLAHIGIKEQTMMTLAMMCLANDVEALQGDPSTKYDDVHKKKVVELWQQALLHLSRG